MEKSCSFMSCDKLDRVANWVGTNVATAFFASLERCSCINLSTTDLEDDEEAKDRPLMLSGPTSHDAVQPSTASDGMFPSTELVEYLAARGCRQTMEIFVYYTTLHVNQDPFTHLYGLSSTSASTHNA
ncbi:hypothetical protein EZV62_010046 [Acer yangbiense]|uniref:Uncharacterized protein n=1 Tax=Acer yangbiense TaxID=1000413 RepID=A0A5C7I3M7_9ROSI|nr:hypothetical protein EZV62_010046 [Acer yangbiense]